MQRSAPDYNEAQWGAWAGGILAGLFSAVSLRVMAVGLASATNACGRLSTPTARRGTHASRVAPDLRYLLAQTRVPNKAQATLFLAGMDSVAKFSASFKDETDLKAVLAKDFSTEPEAVWPTGLWRRRSSWPGEQPRLEPESKPTEKRLTRCGNGRSPSRRRTIWLCDRPSHKNSASPRISMPG